MTTTKSRMDRFSPDVLASSLLTRTIIASTPTTPISTPSTSPGSTSLATAAPATAVKCPVCRRNVDDLLYHFARDHAAVDVPAASFYPTNVRSSSPEVKIGRSENCNNIRGGGEIFPAGAVPFPPATKRLDPGADTAINLSLKKGDFATDCGQDSEESSLGCPRKRKQQTSVPDMHKDQRYWTRRLKNNEAAKKSRDMRIRREKVVFEENARLLAENRRIRGELDALSMENKELQVKMAFVMEDNVRLQEMVMVLRNSKGTGVVNVSEDTGGCNNNNYNDVADGEEGSAALSSSWLATKTKKNLRDVVKS